MTQRDLKAERGALERDYANAWAALKAMPEYHGLVNAWHRLSDHIQLYGTGDLTREPVGIFSASVAPMAQGQPPTPTGNPAWDDFTRAMHEHVKAKQDQATPSRVNPFAR